MKLTKKTEEILNAPLNIAQELYMPMKIFFAEKRMGVLGNKVLFYSFLGILLGLLCTLIYTFEPYPPDDFLRHARFGDYIPFGGYAMMFPYSYFEQLSFNPWIGFDKTIALLREFLQNDSALIMFMQMLFASLFFAALMLNLIIDVKGKEIELQALLVIAVFMLMSYAIARITLIRPCILLGILFLFALKGRGVITGILFSLITAFFYHLFFLYSGVLIISHYLKGCKRFSYGLIVGTLIGLGGWAFYTSGDYFSFLYKLLFSLSDRGDVEIGENVLSFVLFNHPLVFLMSLFFFATLLRTKTVDMYLVLIILTLPFALQIRYFIDLSLPLLLLYTIKNNIDIENFYHSNRKVFEVFAIIAVFLVVPALKDKSAIMSEVQSIREIDIPQGSIVFTDGLPINFAVIFQNPETIRVIPSAEIGFNDIKTKEIIKQAMLNGILPDSFCEYAEEKKINYVFVSYEPINKCLQKIKSFKSKKSQYVLYKTIF